VASYAGTVVDIRTETSGGLIVRIEHDFGQNVQFHNALVDKWYSFYMHLEEASVSVNDVVTAGQQIGKMGDSGLTDHVHLHHEIRVGTPCSLEFAVANPESTCNELGVDPHVNPILVYPNNIVGESSLAVTVKQTVGLDRDGVLIVTGPAERPDANRYLVEVFVGRKRKRRHTLDLNLRQGYDATSTAALDTKDTTKPYLDPQVFQTADSVYMMCLVVPYTWVPNKATKVVVKVFNIMGNKAGEAKLCAGRKRKRCNRSYS
jgi:hypothetical protein